MDISVCVQRRLLKSEIIYLCSSENTHMHTGKHVSTKPIYKESNMVMHAQYKTSVNKY